MESISAFELIKIGIGPSSSHTMGPWNAAERFLAEVHHAGYLNEVNELHTHLFGSLALTGKGHGTDIAIILGLAGESYFSIDTEIIPSLIQKIKDTQVLKLGGEVAVHYCKKEHIHFHYGEYLDYHSNGITFQAILNDGHSLSKTYYSIGGGFITTEEEHKIQSNTIKTPYPCHDARSILSFCKSLNIRVSELVKINERSWRDDIQTNYKAIQIWKEMQACIFRGIQREGQLPGGLGVRRRASSIYRSLSGSIKISNIEDWISHIKNSEKSFRQINSWISCFALAVNEENASFGRVVTAPTNGASGVMPAVMMYAHCFEGIEEIKMIDFILVAGEIGTLFKKNATISAAAGGCQAEIGVSSAMAAAGLTDCLGGSPGQVLMAAEIAMEHHLGMTCDPIGGLVQIPCIERNSMGAIKAITAAHLALQSDPESAKVSLDHVIRTMWETAQNMHSHYKETSEGGLAVNVPVNIVEC